MMNNKLYISGRITGIKYPTAVRNFAKAQEYWERKGYKVVNPINLCKQGWNWYICRQYVCITSCGANMFICSLTTSVAEEQ